MKVCSDDVIPTMLGNTVGWQYHEHRFCNPPFSRLLMCFNLNAAELVLFYQLKSHLCPLTTKQQYVLKVLVLLYSDNRCKKRMNIQQSDKITIWPSKVYNCPLHSSQWWVFL